jgi:hypothetical protein
MADHERVAESVYARDGVTAARVHEDMTNLEENIVAFTADETSERLFRVGKIVLTV